jgi:hypothetical protein
MIDIKTPDQSPKKPEKVASDKKIIYEKVYIEEFAGRIFREIRIANNIDSEMISTSLNPDTNIEKIKKAGESQGKSGSFFFFSHDSKFIIKTMNSGELQTFKKIFKNYEKHLKDNPKSLLARIYGIFTVRLEDIDPIHILLMENTMQYVSGNKISVNSTYDLKGSLVGRLNKDKDASNTDILKDWNIIYKRKTHDILNFSKKQQETIKDQMKKDTKFL